MRIDRRKIFERERKRIRIGIDSKNRMNLLSKFFLGSLTLLKLNLLN